MAQLHDIYYDYDDDFRIVGPFICCLRRQYLRLCNVDRMVTDGDEDFGRKPSWTNGRKTSKSD